MRKRFSDFNLIQDIIHNTKEKKFITIIKKLILIPYINKYTFFVFFSLFFIFTLIYMFLYYGELTINYKRYTSFSTNHIHSLKNSVQRDIEITHSDLLIIAGHFELNQAVLDRYKELELFSNQRKIYDQICFIDEKGMEIIRIQYKNENAYTVDKSNLQYKGNQQYFKESISLNVGQVYVSPLNLNIENGQIEVPYKPILRFATPIINNKGQKIGIVVINYLADKMFRGYEQIEEQIQKNQAILYHSMLVNKDGYWMKNHDKEKEWGFHFEDKKQLQFQNTEVLQHNNALFFPILSYKKTDHSGLNEEWTKISNTENGFFLTKNGFFAFDTIYPSKEKKHSWKLIIHATPEMYFTEPYTFFYKLLTIYIPLLFLFGFGSIIMTNFRKEINHTKERLFQVNTANIRFVPEEFLRILEKTNIIDLEVSECVQKELTILFSDIRSYTSITESLSTEKIFQFLNDYYKSVGFVIRDHNGFIDKYIGDAIMALFPESVEDALKSAIKMKRNIEEFNASRLKNGDAPIKSGFGLHHGSVTLGTVGTSFRMDTTVIGDAVNIASRIESLTKTFKVDILFSSDLYQKISDPSKFKIREIDIVRVKGKNTPVALFESFDADPEDIIEKKLKSREDLQKGLALYRLGDFKAAIELFKNCQEICPEDFVANIYITRSSTMLRIPPGPNWSGISTL